MSCNNCNTGYQECMPRCHEVVETVSEVSSFRNSYVTVLDENATYHVDNRGNVIAVSRNPIYIDDAGYRPVVGEYKNLTVYNFANDEAYVFNNSGEYRVILLYSDGGGLSS